MLVGRNEDTVEALRVYLCGAGVVARSTSSLVETTRMKRATAAVVIFPDGYAAAAAVSAILAIRTRSPRTLIVLVTSLPQTYRPATQPDGRSPVPLVLPRPAYGWTIVDAIRAHVDPPEVLNEP